MGTNYYVEWVPPGQGTDSDSAVSVVSGVPVLKVRMHICKSLTNFNGTVFNSWSAWKHFLWTNRDDVEITSEYGVTFYPDAFAKEVEQTDLTQRGRQYRWMQDNYPSGQHGCWLDSDGFTFSTGDFS